MGQEVVIQLRISEDEFIKKVQDAVQEKLNPIMDVLSAQRIKAKKACELLDVSKPTLNSYVQSGLLKQYKDTPNSHPEYNLSEVIALSKKNPKYKKYV